MTSDSSQGSAWRELAINALASVIAVLAAVIYGILALAYSKFYAELGVRPADAGLEFGAGLAGAAGLTLLIVVVAAIVTCLGVIGWSYMKRRVGPRAAVQTGTAIVSVVGLAFILQFILEANRWADRVKRGDPVEPLSIADVEILGARADLARIEAIGDGRESAMLRELEKRPIEKPELLYLGRAGGHVLLYDSRLQRVEQIPSGSAVVTTFNCETKLSIDPACRRLAGGDQ